MGAPTEADIQDQIGKVCKIYDEMRKFGHVNSPNMLQMEGDLIAAIEGDYSPETLSGWSTVRASYAALMEQAATSLTPLLRTYAQNIGTPETDAQSILTRLFRHFTDNSLTVETRDFTFGTITAGGSNVGNGTVNRLTTDENGDDIENQTADAKTVECIGDEHSGASVEGEERFNVRGTTALRDRIEIAGSGLSAEIRAITARDSRQLLQNPSFDQFEGTVTVPTAVTGWTPTSDIGNFQLNTTTYRDPFNLTTPYSLQIDTNDTLSQNFSVKRAQFNPSVPMYLQIAYNRAAGSGDGTLTLHLGSQSTAVVLAAETGWNVLRIALGTKNWFKNWNQEDPTVAIQLSGNSSGYVLVDDIVFFPMSLFDGAWYSVVGGSTPFLKDDIFTWTDSEVGSIIQVWLHRIFQRYLPHSGSPSWSDPATIDPTPTPTPSPTPTPTP